MNLKHSKERTIKKIKKHTTATTTSIQNIDTTDHNNRNANFGDEIPFNIQVSSVGIELNSNHEDIQSSNNVEGVYFV